GATRAYREAAGNGYFTIQHEMPELQVPDALRHLFAARIQSVAEAENEYVALEEVQFHRLASRPKMCSRTASTSCCTSTTKRASETCGQSSRSPRRHSTKPSVSERSESHSRRCAKRPSDSPSNHS